MKVNFIHYVISLYQNVPFYVYEGLLVLFCISTILIIVYRVFLKGLSGIAVGSIWRSVMGLLLAEYVVLLFCSTIIFRRLSDSVYGYNFQPFWSYAAIQQGVDELIAENVMNVVAFMPIGLLIGTQISHKVQKGWLVAIGVGFLISVSIEILQLVLKRGFVELDDVMHNTIGCIIGYLLFLLIAKSYKISRCERRY